MKNPPDGGLERWMRYSILAAALLLAGCFQDRSQIVAEQSSRCESYGFKPGTEGFANCRMAADTQQRGIQEQRRRDIINSIPDQPFSVPR
jgi:hypothetical protein